MGFLSDGANLIKRPRHMGSLSSITRKYMAMAAIKLDGMKLENVDKALQDDEDVVRAAVQQNGLALFFASERLRCKPDIVLAAMHQNFDALQYASPEGQTYGPPLQGDEAFMMQAVNISGHTLAYAHPHIRNHPQIVLQALQKSPDAFAYASDDLKNNPEFALLAVKDSPYTLQKTGPQARSHPDVVIAALSSFFAWELPPKLLSSTITNHIAPELLADPTFAGRCLTEGLNTDTLCEASGTFAQALTQYLLTQHPPSGLLSCASHEGTASSAATRHLTD